MTVMKAAQHPESKDATSGEDACSLTHQPRARLWLGPHHLPFWPSQCIPECHPYPELLWCTDSASLLDL